MGTVLEQYLYTRQHLAEEVQIELENVQLLSNEPDLHVPGTWGRKQRGLFGTAGVGKGKGPGSKFQGAPGSPLNSDC